MEKKWNLQDIRPAKARPKRAASQPRPRVEHEEEQPHIAPARRSHSSKRRRPLLFGALLLALVLIPGIVIGYLLDGSEITVYPKTREPNVNGTFTAYREQRDNELSYEAMTLEATGERQLRATGEAEVSEQATGELIISNTRATSERLIKNTRFESPEGLIFRITESVVVPAANGDEPGTVRARVFADEPGDQYNIGPTTFTVPGYREGGYDELYAAVTAESTGPMQGGFEGVTYTVDEAELASARESLHEELRGALRERVATERPAGFVVFDNSITFTYESLPSAESGEDLVTISEKALLHAPLFAEQEFASYVAAATVPGYANEPVRMDGAENLTFAYTATSTANSDLRTLDSFEFELTGKPRIVWTFDEEALKNDLAGAAKTALPTVLGSYPAIERAEAVIRPVWKRSFPDSPDSITITESLP